MATDHSHRPKRLSFDIRNELTNFPGSGDKIYENSNYDYRKFPTHNSNLEHVTSAKFSKNIGVREDVSDTSRINSILRRNNSYKMLISLAHILGTPHTYIKLRILLIAFFVVGLLDLEKFRYFVRNLKKHGMFRTLRVDDSDSYFFAVKRL